MPADNEEICREMSYNFPRKKKSASLLTVLRNKPTREKLLKSHADLDLEPLITSTRDKLTSN